MAGVRRRVFPWPLHRPAAGSVPVAVVDGDQQRDFVDAPRAGAARLRLCAAAAAAPAPYPYYPHNGETLYQANVVAVRAVVGPPEQRCWVEQQQVVSGGGPNVGGAVIGGILGGVLGHQIGSGRGNDVATAVGAVTGAAVGANVNRGGRQVTTQNVQRCRRSPDRRSRRTGT